ncbi:hypothetical protein B0H17DRAFT_1195117 [Mycena rosella]|uniref:Uncharacterized protein n=1 Tax=Mycena rosella TaxID=1033263 RepID=A0AAD7DX68_MYCRO|nr:hypothetical protein B0H17DRAFT_1195117 [Mycena rosella]
MNSCTVSEFSVLPVICPPMLGDPDNRATSCDSPTHGASPKPVGLSPRAGVGMVLVEEVTIEPPRIRSSMNTTRSVMSRNCGPVSEFPFPPHWLDSSSCACDRRFRAASCNSPTHESSRTDRKKSRQPAVKRDTDTFLRVFLDHASIQFASRPREEPLAAAEVRSTAYSSRRNRCSRDAVASGSSYMDTIRNWRTITPSTTVIRFSPMMLRALHPEPGSLWLPEPLSDWAL